MQHSVVYLNNLLKCTRTRIQIGTAQWISNCCLHHHHCSFVVDDADDDDDDDETADERVTVRDESFVFLEASLIYSLTLLLIIILLFTLNLFCSTPAIRFVCVVGCCVRVNGRSEQRKTPRHLLNDFSSSVCSQTASYYPKIINHNNVSVTVLAAPSPSYCGNFMKKKTHTDRRSEFFSEFLTQPFHWGIFMYFIITTWLCNLLPLFHLLRIVI